MVKLSADYFIRQATSKDLESIVALLRAEMRELYPTGDPAEQQEAVRRHLSDRDGRVDAVTLLLLPRTPPGLPLGFVRVDIVEAMPILSGVSDGDAMGYIEELYVNPLYRCQGFGKALVEQAIEYLKGKSVSHVYSHVSGDLGRLLDSFPGTHSMRAIALDLRTYTEHTASTRRIAV